MTINVSNDEGFLNSGSSSTYSLRRAKTKRGKRILESRLPQVNENIKNSLLFKGSKANAYIQNLLNDLHTLRKPHSVNFSSKNQQNIRLFEENDEIERLCKKTNSAFFVIGVSTKKKPNRVVFGRIFEDKVLDMFSFNVMNYFSLSSFILGRRKQKAQEGLSEQDGLRSEDMLIPLNSKPLVICQGAGFESNEVLKNAKNLLCDFFTMYKSEKISLNSLSHAIVLTSIVHSDETGNSFVNPYENNKEDLRNVVSSHLGNIAVGNVVNSNVANSAANNPKFSTCSGKTAEQQKNKRSLVPSPTCSNLSILVRHYRIKLKKSETSIPRVDLQEVGPCFDLDVDNFKIADKDIWKLATKIPKEVVQKKQKNVKTNLFGQKRGRVFVEKQDFSTLHTPHFHQYAQLKNAYNNNTQKNDVSPNADVKQQTYKRRKKD